MSASPQTETQILCSSASSLLDVMRAGHKRKLLFAAKVSLAFNLGLFLTLVAICFFPNCENVHQRALAQHIAHRKETSTRLNPNAHSFVKWMARVTRNRNPNGIRLTHVVIPFHVRQLGQMVYVMEQWRTFPPCPSLHMLQEMHVDSHTTSLGRDISLIIYLNTRKDTDVEKRVAQAFADLPDDIRGCFREMNFRYADLVGERDSYLMGSRMMFEQMLKGYIGMGAPEYGLYMEPDCFPVRPYWLSHIDAQTRVPGPMFWLKGSIFRGDMNVVGRTNIVNMFHINGNALYNLGDPALGRFYFDRIRPFIENKVKKEGAYDTDFAVYLQHGGHLAEALGLAHRYQFSDFIQNLYHSNYSISELVATNIVTDMVHGGYPHA